MSRNRNAKSKKKRPAAASKNTATRQPPNPGNAAEKDHQSESGATSKRRLLIPLVIGLLAVAVVLALTVFSGGGGAIRLDENTNLLVITLDTMRADRIGAYGYEEAQTPNLDRLAREGVLFENCYSPVPLTLPSHSTLFTGRYPVAHGVRGNGIYLLPGAEVTLAEKMKANGYQTAGVISSFVLLSKFGLNQGFDFFDDSLDSHKMYNNYTSEIPATS
ncbi:MAG: sulfatase-like hydrolase/transferase, partial [bacterium]|nr:sulfatase-like hydrolase/transferase [bacterium]